jgi:hypothetical protein
VSGVCGIGSERKTTDEDRAVRSNEIHLEESARLLERHEQGPKGHAYRSGQT